MNTSRLGLPILALAISLLAACATVSLVPAGTTTVNSISFISSGEWNQMPSSMVNLGPNTVTCTADGLGLDRLIVISHVKSGKGMFADTSKELPMPRFDPQMLPHDLESFVLSSLTNLDGGSTRYDSSGLRPMQFGDVQGVNFQIAFSTEAGLAMRGDVLAAIKGGEFHAIIYIAAGEHYYDKYKDEIGKLFGSANII